MTSVDSTAIPRERIPAIARESASTAKSIAGVLGFLSIIIALAMFSSYGEIDDEKAPTDPDERAGYEVGRLINPFIFAGVPAFFAFRAARRGSRATRAAEIAAADSQTTWRLAGKLLVAERGGAPVPELSFTISGKSRTMLLAVPKAELVDRPS